MAPAGLEPAHSFERGILKPDQGYAGEREGDDSDTCDTQGRTAAPECTPKVAQGVQQTSAKLDPVEIALANAVTGATAAGQWEVVAQLARELEARRLARQAPEVVSIELARAKRGGN